MSYLELRGHDGQLLHEAAEFQIDVIDLLGPDELLLYIWTGTVWSPAEQDDDEGRIHLYLEPAEPDGRTEINFRDLAAPAPAIAHSWSGTGPLFFRPEPAGLGLVSAATIDADGELLARLDRDSGIWSVPGLDECRFDKLFFEASPVAHASDGPRDRLSLLAEQ